jgi:hypothetical protein
VTLEALLKCLGVVVLESPKTVSEAEFSVAVGRRTVDLSVPLSEKVLRLFFWGPRRWPEMGDSCRFSVDEVVIQCDRVSGHHSPGPVVWDVDDLLRRRRRSSFYGRGFLPERVSLWYFDFGRSI